METDGRKQSLESLPDPDGLPRVKCRDISRVSIPWSSF